MKIRTRRGIGTVITTMIILVASVILGTGVVIYGTSMFQSSGQVQSVTVYGVKTWVNQTAPNGISWGAFAIRNSGDKIYSIDTISVRGASIPFSNWYYANSTNSLANLQDSFVYGTNDGSGILKPYLGTPPSTNTCNPAAILRIDVDGTGPRPMICMTQASGQITLKPGEAAIVYFHLPDGVFSSIDTGGKSSIAISAAKGNAPLPVVVGSP